MKLISILILCILTLPALGQTSGLRGKVDSNTDKPENENYNNTPLKVIFLDTIQPDRQSAFYIDGKHFNETIIKTINPNLVDSIFVVKEEISIEGKNFIGQIHITMKGEYKPEIISLADLRFKYIKQSNAPSIFIINNEIVKSSYDEFLVDENYILKIEVQHVENEKENLNVYVIRLITKTEENIEKANEISIKGIEDLIVN
jgi:hypothetical protein